MVKAEGFNGFSVKCPLTFTQTAHFFIIHYTAQLNHINGENRCFAKALMPPQVLDVPVGSLTSVHAK